MSFMTDPLVRFARPKRELPVPNVGGGCAVALLLPLKFPYSEPPPRQEKTFFRHGFGHKPPWLDARRRFVRSVAEYRRPCLVAKADRIDTHSPHPPRDSPHRKPGWQAPAVRKPSLHKRHSIVLRRRRATPPRRPAGIARRSVAKVDAIAHAPETALFDQFAYGIVNIMVFRTRQTAVPVEMHFQVWLFLPR